MAMILDEPLAFGGGFAVDSRPPSVAEGDTVRIPSEPRVRDWGYVGLLAFTAVLMLRPQDHIRALAVLHLAQLSAFIGLGAMIAGRVKRNQSVIPLTPETIGLLFFGFVMLGTVPFSIWPGGALSEFIETYLKVVMVFILMVNTLTTPKRLEQLSWLIVVCCGYIAFRAVFDYARGANLVEGGRVGGAVSGIFGNPNDLALNMVTFVPAALMMVLNRRLSLPRRAFTAGIVVLMAATIVFTKSRAGVLGMGAMLAALLYLGRRERPGLAFAALAAVLLATPLLPSSFFHRMATIGNEEVDKAEFTGSATARRLLMEEALKTFVDHPITGVGMGQFTNYNPPDRQEKWRETHNSPLQVAADLGIFGLAAFAFLIICAAIASSQARRFLAPRRRNAPDPLGRTMAAPERESLYDYSVALTSGLVGWFVCSLFASIAYSWTFYYLLALLVATRDVVRTRRALAMSQGVSVDRATNAAWRARIA
jgi:putative inorganic carbon (hco3(-)) transporter